MSFLASLGCRHEYETEHKGQYVVYKCKKCGVTFGIGYTVDQVKKAGGTQ